MTAGNAERIPEDVVERARAQIKVSEIVGRYVALKKIGTEFGACCPFHGEKSPSFFVNDKKGFYHCFGCGAHGDGIAALMQLGGLSFRDAVQSLMGGVLPTARTLTPPIKPATVARDDSGERRLKPLALWNLAEHAAGSLAQTYCESRGILLPMPASIRFRPSEPYWDGDPPRIVGHFPCLIAAICDARSRVVAVQRIYLTADGKGKAAVARPKKVLGGMGAGAVQLSAMIRDRLGIAEGIETGLSAMQIHKVPVWAACGGARMKDIAVPPWVRAVTIFRDTGPDGLAKANAAAEAFLAQDKNVLILPPPEQFKDWNDVLTGV